MQMNKNSDRAKVRAISFIFRLFLIPMFILIFGSVIGGFLSLENGSPHPLHFGAILLWIGSLILFSIGVIGLKGLFAKKLYGKWMAFAFSLLFWKFFIGRGLSKSFWSNYLRNSKGIFFNKLNNYKIIQFLFNPIVLISLLLVIAIALILSLPKSYFSENGEVNSKING